MYAIIFVLLLIVLAAGAFLTHLMSATNRTDRHITVDTVRITAQQGAQVLNACEKETTAGAYTVANLVSSGYLPNGYAQNTPLRAAMGVSGEFWWCERTECHYFAFKWTVHQPCGKRVAGIS